MGEGQDLRRKQSKLNGTERKQNAKSRKMRRKIQSRIVKPGGQEQIVGSFVGERRRDSGGWRGVSGHPVNFIIRKTYL